MKKRTISIKVVKAAGVTMEDCLTQPEPRVIVEQGPATVVEPVPAPSPVTIVIPAPVIMQTVASPISPLVSAEQVVAVAKAEKQHKVRHPNAKPCVTNDTIQK